MKLTWKTILKSWWFELLIFGLIGVLFAYMEWSIWIVVAMYLAFVIGTVTVSLFIGIYKAKSVKKYKKYFFPENETSDE